MQTFMKMAGAVYTMAGLGSIEDSKLFKEKFDAYVDKDQVLIQSKNNIYSRKIIKIICLSDGFFNFEPLERSNVKFSVIIISSVNEFNGSGVRKSFIKNQNVLNQVRMGLL